MSLLFYSKGHVDVWRNVAGTLTKVYETDNYNLQSLSGMQQIEQFKRPGVAQQPDDNSITHNLFLDSVPRTTYQPLAYDSFIISNSKNGNYDGAYNCLQYISHPNDDGDDDINIDYIYIPVRYDGKKKQGDDSDINNSGVINLGGRNL